MRPGDTVLDIGSGSGTDVLYATLKVGPKGTVYGLDITPAMIAKARTNIAKTGARNVQILEGDATKSPLRERSSNLCPGNGLLLPLPAKCGSVQALVVLLKVRVGH